MTGLRVFDLVGNKMVGVLMAEDADGVILEYPGVMTVGVRPATKDTFKTTVRFDPVFQAKMYKIHRHAIRGEYYVYDPNVLRAYDAFTLLAAAGKFDLVPFSSEKEVELITQSTESPEATVAEGKLSGAGDAPTDGQ